MVVVITKAMEKSRFVRSDPSVHEVMRRLMSELTQRSNRGQPLVPTSLRRSELQYDLFIPRYEIQHPSSVSISMADHLKILGFVGGIFTQMFVRDKRVQLPRKLSFKLGRSLFNKVGIGKNQCASSSMENMQKKNDDDFVPARYLNEYSSNNSPDKDPKNLTKVSAVDSGVDQADEEKMCIETLIQSPDEDPKNLSDDDEFEQQKVVLGLSAFARGMDRADEEKMCIESAPLPTTLIQSSDKKDPENMSDDDNEFKKQKIVSGLPDVGCGVDRADAKKMRIGRKPQLTTSGQLMASSRN